jgi:RsiW-degrading membrane proteinase PrsW (M82 family)
MTTPPPTEPRRSASRTEVLATRQALPRHERTAALISCSVIILLFGTFSALCIGFEVLFSFALHPLWSVASLFFAVVLGLPHIAVVLWLDRNEPEPWWLLLLAWAWGAVMATGLSVVVNGVFEGVALGISGDEAIASQLAASVSAPIFEEITKGAAIVAIYLFFRSHFDNVLDGIVYGAMVGMGFAMVENFIYYQGPIVAEVPDAGAQWASLVIARGVLTGVGTHWCFTAITGAGLGIYRVLRSGWLRALVPPAALALSIFAHFGWNTFTQLFIFAPDDGLTTLFVSIPLAVIVLQTPFIVLVLLVATVSGWHEGVLIRRYLKDEPRSVLLDGELHRLYPSRRRLGYALGLLFRGRFSQWLVARRRHRLLIQLAFERWHLDQEARVRDDDQASDHARKVMALRRKLREIR